MRNAMNDLMVAINVATSALMIGMAFYCIVYLTFWPNVMPSPKLIWLGLIFAFLSAANLLMPSLAHPDRNPDEQA